MIETDRLILRRFTMDDVSAAYRNWTSDAQVTSRVIGDWVKRYGREDFYRWAIELKSLGEPIGSISVVDMDERTDKIHVGYCIGSRWWRMGITSETFSAIIPFFFTEVGVNRIESQHDPENPNSGRVMQSCGLRYEGMLRQADWSNRGLVDACMYSLLKSDFFGE